MASTHRVLVEVVRCAMSWPSFMFDGGVVWALADAGQHADVPFHLIPKKRHEWETRSAAQERPWQRVWTRRRTTATRRTWILVQSP